MKKVKKIILTVSVISMTIMACSSENIYNEADSSRSSWKQENITENVMADFTLHETYAERWKTYQIMKIAQTEALSDQKIIDAKELFFPQDSSKYVIEFVDDPTEPMKTLTTENGTLVNYGLNLQSGGTAECDIYNDFIYFETGEDTLVNESKDEELSFMTREEVKSLIKEKLSVFTESQYDIYEIDVQAYTCEYLSKLVKVLSDSQYNEFINPSTLEHSWVQADEFYAIHVTFSCDGLPIRDYNWGSGELYLRSVGANFWLSKDGIINFDINIPPALDEGKAADIRMCDQVLNETIRNRYENIIMKEQLVIRDAVLMYGILPDAGDGREYMAPIWKFTMDVDTGAGSGENEVILQIDAITGRVIE